MYIGAMRVVLDTNVLTSGLRSRRGAAFAVLLQIASRKLRPIVTTSLFLEYEDVLLRPAQREALALSPDDTQLFLAEFAALSEGVHVHFRWRPQLRDPKDEMVLEAAINGKAEALVTYNLRDFVGVADRFGIEVMTPFELLRRVET